MRMTEKEFEARLNDLLMSGAPAETIVSISKQVAREAGLEFAPEPVEPPERLEVRMTVGGGPYLAPEQFNRFDGLEHLTVSLELARDRYNAYPGLRKAAEAVLNVSAPIKSWGWDGEDRRGFILAHQGLEAELAKGPK